MTSITSSHTTPDVEPTDEEIRNTIIDEGVIRSLHGINYEYVQRIEKCRSSHWKKSKFIGKEKTCMGVHYQ